MTAHRTNLDDNSEIYDRIMQIVDSRVGEKQAINQRELPVQLHQISYKFRHEIPYTRTLLRVIHDMRRAGFVIASCARGYFKPANGAEAKKYLNAVLVSRARDLEETITAQRRAIYLEYSGQIGMEE